MQAQTCSVAATLGVSAPLHSNAVLIANASVLIIVVLRTAVGPIVVLTLAVGLVAPVNPTIPAMCRPELVFAPAILMPVTLGNNVDPRFAEPQKPSSRWVVELASNMPQPTISLVLGFAPPICALAPHCVVASNVDPTLVMEPVVPVVILLPIPVVGFALKPRVIHPELAFAHRTVRGKIAVQTAAVGCVVTVLSHLLATLVDFATVFPVAILMELRLLLRSLILAETISVVAVVARAHNSLSATERFATVPPHAIPCRVRDGSVALEVVMPQPEQTCFVLTELPVPWIQLAHAQASHRQGRGTPRSTSASMASVSVSPTVRAKCVAQTAVMASVDPIQAELVPSTASLASPMFVIISPSNATAFPTVLRSIPVVLTRAPVPVVPARQERLAMRSTVPTTVPAQHLVLENNVVATVAEVSVVLLTVPVPLSVVSSTLATPSSSVFVLPSVPIANVVMTVAWALVARVCQLSCAMCLVVVCARSPAPPIGSVETLAVVVAPTRVPHCPVLCPSLDVHRDFSATMLPTCAS